MESLSLLANPWQVSLPLWLGGVVVKEVALQGMDWGVRIAGRYIEPMPSRKGEKEVYQRPLDFMDYLYLSINAVIETVFIGHLLHYLWYSSKVERSFGALGLLNGPVALWLVVIFNDMFYAPLHRLLHTPMLYRWIHKHHHRITYPQRGNVDARNEHPVEQMLAMAFWYCAVQLATVLVGMHAIVVPLHISIMVFGACFNHTENDLKFSVFGIEFAVRAHEMHHRMPNKNFGQICMWFDKLMGTYIPYMSADA